QGKQEAPALALQEQARGERMSRIEEHLETVKELCTRVRRLVYILSHETFALVYEAADAEAREEADDYVSDIDPDSLKVWYEEQRQEVWAGWTLKEIRRLASDERIRNCREKSREQLIREIGIGPAEAKEKVRGKNPGVDQGAAGSPRL